MTDPTALQLAVNQSLDQARMAIARQRATFGSLDTKRPLAYCDFGWPTDPDFDTFHQLYERGGVAHGAVNQLVDKCWQSAPELIEGDEFDSKKPKTPWEISIGKTLKQLKLWKFLKIADTRRLVGRYSGLLVQLRDGGKWDAPVGRRKNMQVVRLIPAWEGQLKPSAWDTDATSENYGQVAQWTFKVPGENGMPGVELTVHPDRVMLLGDIREGVSFLKAGLNAFINLEKIEGGSGESFLKNAARQLNLNFDKDVKLDDIARANGVPLNELQDAFNDAARELNRGNDLLMVTQGATVTPLVANVPDPNPGYQINLTTAAASVMMPTRILAGSQSGERASTEDNRAFNARGQGRRVNELSDDIEAVIRHLARLGVVPPVSEFFVMWDDLTESTQAENLAAAKTMAEIDSLRLASGEAVFTNAEIRDTAGLEGEPEGVLPELDPADVVTE